MIGGVRLRTEAQSRVAASPLARLVALPVRLATVVRLQGRDVRRALIWLVRSREHHNYTYDLDPRNRRHLAHWVSVLTNTATDRVLDIFDELESNAELEQRIRSRTRSNPRWRLADDEVRYGRRLGWYALVRILEPELIVETGTDKGLGTCVLAEALVKNGHGRLVTMDINPASGYLVSNYYGGTVEHRLGDSVDLLERSPDGIDFFLHDSWHSYEHESAEYAAVERHLSSRAVVLSDNAHEADALLDWSDRHGRRFHFFKEVPYAHWYPGEGIGCSWPSVEPL